jgi:hypothetical protein
MISSLLQKICPNILCLNYKTYVFGGSLSFFGILFDLIRLNKQIPLENIILIRIINPIHLIIYAAPLSLSMFALIVGIKQDLLIRKNQQLVCILKIKDIFQAT